MNLIQLIILEFTLGALFGILISAVVMDWGK